MTVHGKSHVNNNSVLPQKNNRYLHEQEIHTEFHEPYITSGYRKPGITFYQCLASLFKAHNETINIWTHLAALIGFVFLCVPVFIANNPLNDSFVYPLLAYAVGTCSMLIMSSLAHVFNCMSVKVRHICFFLDYAAISTYTFTAGQVFFFYSRPTNTDVFVLNSATAFLGVSAAISTVTTYMCCSSRHSWIRHKFFIRTGTYASSWMFNTLPYIARAFLCDNEKECNSASFKYFNRQVIYFFVAAISNAIRIPERLIPGFFDFFGQSHHFLHILCSLGSVEVFTAVELDVKMRRELLTSCSSVPTFANSLGLMLVVLICNIAIVVWFAIKCPQAEQTKCGHTKAS